MRKLRIIEDERGQVIPFVAFSMFALILFLGLAIDIGHVRYVKRSLQAAADAAALAAALEVRVCGGATSCPAMLAAAQNALVENGLTGSTVLTNCATPTSTTLTLTINNPVCQVASDPNGGKSNYVEAVVTEAVPTYFARLVGFSSFNVRARSEAARGLGGPCIYALNPGASGALSIVAGLGFHSSCGIVVESNSPSAVTCLIGAAMSAPEIRVTGNTASLLCGLNSPVTTGVPAPTPADPLGYLPAPDNAGAACGSSVSSPYYGSATPVNLVLPLAANIVFNPGVYCGGISITAALLSSITFNPGIYILKNGQGSLLGIPGPTTSGLTITAGLLSSITGTGVMFYNEGDGGGFSITATPPLLGLTNFKLSAPTSGDYGGVLFFQAHGVNNTGTFLVSLLEGSAMNGGVYEPDALVSYGVGVISSAHHYNFLVADRVQFTAQILSSFSNDYSSLSSGSPLNGDASALVQ